MRNVTTMLADLIAIAFWVYLVLVVFGAEEFHPSLKWVSSSRLYVLAGGLAAMLLAWRWKWMRYMMLRTTFFPLIVAFWKAPKLMLKNYAVTVAFLPVLWDFVVTFFPALASYLVAAVALATITNSSYSALVIVGMVAMSWTLYAVCKRALLRCYQGNVFDKLAEFVGKVNARLGDENEVRSFFGATLLPVGTDKPDGKKVTEADHDAPYMTVYVGYKALETIKDQLASPANRRKIDLYLFASWAFVAAYGCFVFSVLYYGLGKLYSQSFSGASSSTVFGYLGYSFSRYFGQDISSVKPDSDAAVILSYVQLGFSRFTDILLLFTFLTVARDGYHGNSSKFVSEIKKCMGTVAQTAQGILELTVDGIEAYLMIRNAVFVNEVRRIRGERALATPTTPPQSSPNGTGPPNATAPVSENEDDRPPAEDVKT